MKVLIFGAGAVGSLLGAVLSRSHDVTVVGRRAHVERIRTHGLRVTGRTEILARPRAVESVAELAASQPRGEDGPPDVVIVTVKSHDTAAAAEALRPFGDSSLFFSLQSGLGNAEALAERAERVLAGITHNRVTLAGPGEIVHTAWGGVVMGPWKGASREDAKSLAAALEESGLRAMVTVDGLPTALWDKALADACWGPVTGLLGVGSGSLARSAELMRCVGAILDEALAVAHARGIELDREALLERLRTVSRATPESRSSVLQDLERGRRTEIDSLNGGVAALGEALGIACPMNRTLTLLVKAAEARPGSVG